MDQDFAQIANLAHSLVVEISNIRWVPSTMIPPEQSDARQSTRVPIPQEATPLVQRRPLASPFGPDRAYGSLHFWSPPKNDHRPRQESVIGWADHVG